MNALITGGSSGIGLGLKRALEAKGWHVISWSRGSKVDIRKPDQVKFAALALQVQLDLVVHNAGVYHFEGFSFSRATIMEQTYSVNVAGADRVHEWLTNYNRIASGATIIAISSVDVGKPIPHQAGYQCSKAALEMLVKTWELEEPQYKYRIYRAHLTDTGIWDPVRGPADYTLEQTVGEICQLIQY